MGQKVVPPPITALNSVLDSCDSISLIFPDLSSELVRKETPGPIKKTKVCSLLNILYFTFLTGTTEKST